jgi:hypothetical protein
MDISILNTGDDNLQTNSVKKGTKMVPSLFLLNCNHSPLSQSKENIKNPLKSFNLCPKLISFRSLSGFILSFFKSLMVARIIFSSLS